MTGRARAWFGAPGRRIRLVAFAVVALLLTAVVHNLNAKTVSGEPAVPTSAAMEDATGVRFSRVAVVGDGGLLEVSYTVLDADKATRFQADQAHPPVITNEQSGVSTRRVALMKQGHSLRVGQSYYLIFNNADTVHTADHAAIVAAGTTLPGFPVQ